MQLPAKIFSNKNLIAIYCNKLSTERFLVGVIMALDADYIALSLISPEGIGDGICLCSMKSVFRIELDSQYLLKLKKSVSLPTTRHLLNNLWDDFWLHLEDRKFRVQIKGFSGKQIACGIPVEHTKDVVFVRRISSNNSLGKVIRINRDKIAIVICNSAIVKDAE